MQYYEKLVNSVRRGVVAPVYLFFGEEIYLREEIIKHFKKGLLNETADFNWDVLDGEQTDVDTVVSTASTPPFMAEKRLVLVKDAPWFGSGKGRRDQQGDGGKAETVLDPLLEYLDNPLITTCLIFNCQTIDRRKKIVKSIEKTGRVVNFEQLKGKDLALWLDKQASHHGKKLLGPAREMLVTSTSTGLTGLVGEWEKLLTYIGKGEKITVEDVQQVVHQSVEYRIFDVLDTIGARRYREALTALKELLLNGTAPQIILTMVAWQFRLMLQVSELYRRGLTPPEMARMLKEKPFSVQKSLTLSKNFSVPQLINILSQLAQLDADTKTGRQEFYAGLEQLILGIAVSSGQPSAAGRW